MTTCDQTRAIKQRAGAAFVGRETLVEQRRIALPAEGHVPGFT